MVITASAPPTNESGDELQAKSSQGNPSGSTSVEEFGINLVDNSSPDVGANPRQRCEHGAARIVDDVAEQRDRRDEHVVAVADPAERRCRLGLLPNATWMADMPLWWIVLFSTSALRHPWRNTPFSPFL